MRAEAPRLLADIGGTNARFALQRPGQPPARYRVLKTADHPGLGVAIARYLALVRPARIPDVAAIAVAAPVLGDAIALTNSSWSFSTDAVARAAGLTRLHVLNDFEVLAWALATFGRDDLRKIGRGRPAAQAPCAVFGPGTGLGVSCFLPEAAGGPAALASEGGHTSLAAGTAREAAVIEVLRKRFGHVSAERLLSGPGLANIYWALTRLDNAADAELMKPGVIAREARHANDPRALEAVAMFSALAGQFAGDLALTFGARGGVYVAGGVIPRLGTAFDTGLFRRRFEAKGRFGSWLQRVPTWLITHPRPAMPGLARYLDLVWD
ncbi:MAG: glucokinase [Alphaproteobacteria bacterium]|nr:glucokinase [Alphaproteobacteria bacterium]